MLRSLEARADAAAADMAQALDAQLFGYDADTKVRDLRKSVGIEAPEPRLTGLAAVLERDGK